MQEVWSCVGATPTEVSEALSSLQIDSVALELRRDVWQSARLYISSCETVLVSHTLQKIADNLNAEGFTTKEDKPFHPMQVKRILDRKAFYEGIYRYSGVEVDGKHQRILD
jgi:glutaminase